MPTRQDSRRRGEILGVLIDAVSWDGAVGRIMQWAHASSSAYVTICNVHVVVSASRDPGYRDVINASGLALPDGMPVAWMLRLLGFKGQQRISGPDLMPVLCRRCAEEGVPVFIYGGSNATLDSLGHNLCAAYPDLIISGTESPPYRDLTPDEESSAVDRINASGARILFVALGCPKQEAWMAEHSGKVNAVMVGVGAAVDFHAGNMKRAPRWMRDSGLEWLHRLAAEPRRLWKRYLVTNTLFILGVIKQLGLRR